VLAKPVRFSIPLTGRASFLYPIMIPIIPTHKFCRACNTTKTGNDFFKDGGHADGLQTRCRACTNERKRNRDAPKLSKIKKALLPKPAPEEPEPIVDISGIYEVENRGRGRRSFRFESPIDGSVFSYESFKDARQARQSMMATFKQLAAYDSTHRQSTAARRATAAEDDFE
jgi:hypothetical protein